jgi:transposase
LEVWFEDEARFGQQGTTARCWARRGSRPRAVKQTRYAWVHELAAACPATGQTEGLLVPRLDTDIVNLFLEQVSQQIAPNVHVVLIWDCAAYHTAQHLDVPDNITPVYLPPKSPELNPIENYWHYQRSHYWANRAYADEEVLYDVACQAWQAINQTPERIQSTCHVSYLERINFL